MKHVTLVFGMLFILSVFVSSQQDKDKAWIVSPGKGETTEDAIIDGWQKAILKYLREEMDSIVFHKNKDEITAFVMANWKNYVYGDPQKPAIVSQDANKVVIKVRIKRPQLLSDIQSTILRRKLSVEKYGKPGQKTVEKKQPTEEENHGNGISSPKNYSTEGKWLVQEICQDIAKMLLYAKTKSLSDSFTLAVTGQENKLVVQVNCPELKISFSQPLVVEDSLWTTQPFKPFANKLIEVFGLSNSEPVSAPILVCLSNLADLKAANIETQNQRVSLSLKNNMLNKRAHEEAAFVLGAFGLREAAGNFSDIRFILCRIVAHLTLADVLSSDVGFCEIGDFAKILLLTLEGQQTKALDAIFEMKTPKRSREAEIWLRALAMRNNHDWRALTRAENASLLERLEYFRALVYCTSTDLGMVFLQKKRPEDIPDWGRITFSHAFSVQQGHAFSRSGMALEMQELGTVWKMRYEKPIDENQLISVLNTPASSCVHIAPDGKFDIHVIPWGIWAAFSQRHICHHIQQSYHFMKHLWGVSDYAQKYAEQTRQHFSQLTLYPVVTLYCYRNVQELGENMNTVISSYAEKPEILNLNNWILITINANRYASNAKDMPDPIPWFYSDISAGPIFGGALLFYNVKVPKEYVAFRIEMMRRARPFDFEFISWDFEKLYGYRFAVNARKNLEQEIKRSFGPLGDYHLGVMRMLADQVRNNPEEFRTRYEKICALNPNDYFVLGQYLVQQKIDALAADAFQKGVDLGTNRVLVANNCGWLADYYYKNGKEKEAMEIAKMAATVYSYQGLAVMAALLERMGKLDEAEQYYRKIYERYQTPADLLKFYKRWAEKPGGEKYKEKLQELENK